MKPTSLLIPALGLLASCAIGAPVMERSNAAIPRAETLPEGVVASPDVSKRDEDTAGGIVTTVDGVVTDVDNTVDGIVTDVDKTVNGVVTDVDNAVDGIDAAVGRRGVDHREGVITFPIVSKRDEDTAGGIVTTVDGIVTDVDNTVDGVVTDVDNTVNGIDAAVGRRGVDHRLRRE